MRERLFGLCGLPDDIRIWPACAKEITSIIRGTGIEEDFADCFETRIRLLERYKKRVIGLDPKKFKKATGYRDLYEMKFKLRPNIRILFTFVDERMVYLLCAFPEKKSDADYEKANKLAIERLKSLRACLSENGWAEKG